MVRLDAMIREDQKKSLESLLGNTSEHVRAAIDDYLMKKRKENMTVSLSPSQISKGGI